MTPPDVLLPQSAAVQAVAAAIVVTAAVVGLVTYFWGRSHGENSGFCRGYAEAWPRAHDAGFRDGLREAGVDSQVLDRLVALDELQQDAEFRREAGMRRWRAAVEAWNAEGRKWA